MYRFVLRNAGKFSLHLCRDTGSIRLVPSIFDRITGLWNYGNASTYDDLSKHVLAALLKGSPDQSSGSKSLVRNQSRKPLFTNQF